MMRGLLQVVCGRSGGDRVQVFRFFTRYHESKNTKRTELNPEFGFKSFLTVWITTDTSNSGI